MLPAKPSAGCLASRDALMPREGTAHDGCKRMSGPVAIAYTEGGASFRDAREAEDAREGST
jgi:hypothetical protein